MKGLWLHEGFSWMPLVENWRLFALAAVPGTAALWSLHLTIFNLVYGACLLCFLLAVSWLDIGYGRIYNKFLLPMAIMGFFYRLALRTAWLAESTPVMLESLAGVLLGGIFLGGVRLVSHGGLGGGDVKLAMVLGLWLGAEELLWTIYVAFFSGSLAALWLTVTGNKPSALPFGSCLAWGAYLAYGWGEMWEQIL
ncbi:MAG: prepilin peptidase [Selenomonadaceae bacterium]|nr:prepilin peptidase [Selenomonadaceae bacterium]